MRVNKKIDQTDGFALTVYRVIMSNKVSVFLSKLEEDGKNTAVAYFGKLGSFYEF